MISNFTLQTVILLLCNGWDEEKCLFVFFRWIIGLIIGLMKLRYDFYIFYTGNYFWWVVTMDPKSFFGNKESGFVFFSADVNYFTLFMCF